MGEQKHTYHPKKQDKGKPIYGLAKIPTDMLLRQANVENGKLRAYIDELEYENGKLRERLTERRVISKEERREIMASIKDELLTARKKEIATLQKKLRNMRDNYNEIMNKYLAVCRTNQKEST